MSLYVVDASVAAKWFIPETHAEEARRLLAGPNELRAPDMLWLEMHSIVCRHIRRNQFPRDQGLQILSALHAFPIQIFPSADLLDYATAVALDTAASVYDCIYLALAIRLDARVVTADLRFYHTLRLGPLADRVEWVGDLR